jgi:RNA polymerase sigma factor (sigma-70 family)
MRTKTNTGVGGLAAELAHDRDAAFPRLVRTLQDGLFAGALRLTGSRADAEEITQESFVRAYRALKSYPDERVRELRVREWLWTITLNLCRNRARARARRPEAPSGEDAAVLDPMPGPEQQALATADRESLEQHLARLPWATRASLVLRYVADLPYAEIATALDRPVGTVRSDVHRGLQRLRQSLKEES